MKYVSQLVLVVSTLGIVTLLSAGTVHAFSLHAGIVLADAKGAACAGIGLAGGGCGDNGAAVNNAIKVFIEIFSAVIGVAAVIMIIIAGFRFITSAGDTSKVAAAKSSVIYAIVGLVIVAIAQSIVWFVLTKA